MTTMRVKRTRRKSQRAAAIKTIRKRIKIREFLPLMIIHLTKKLMKSARKRWKNKQKRRCL